jgi:hypothetical protein
MFGQLQVSDYRRRQQTHHIGVDRVFEAGEDFFGYGRAAKQMSPLLHQHLAATPGQICRGRQAIMPAADYDNVVVFLHA